MRLLTIALLTLAVQGCIYTQSGFIRNDSSGTVFVGDPAQSSYSKIESNQTADKDFIYCLEIASFEESRYYGVSQVSDGVYFSDGSAIRVDSPYSKIPADAYHVGGPLYDVVLIYTDDGLFFDSATQGLVPVPESIRCSKSDTALIDRFDRLKLQPSPAVHLEWSRMTVHNP